MNDEAQELKVEYQGGEVSIAPAHQVENYTERDERYNNCLNNLLALLYKLLIDSIVFFVVLVAFLPVRVTEDRVEYSAKVEPEVDQPVLCAQTFLDLHEFVLILTTRAESFCKDHLRKSESSNNRQRLFL